MFVVKGGGGKENTQVFKGASPDLQDIGVSFIGRVSQENS